jgi:hypothetical protein
MAGRIILYQQSDSAADDSSKNAKGEVCLAPSQPPDEKRGKRRHNQRADPDAADCQSGREGAAPCEPALDCPYSGHIRAADAKSDPKTVRRIDLP